MEIHHIIMDSGRREQWGIGRQLGLPTKHVVPVKVAGIVLSMIVLITLM